MIENGKRKLGDVAAQVGFDFLGGPGVGRAAFLQVAFVLAWNRCALKEDALNDSAIADQRQFTDLGFEFAEQIHFTRSSG